jgi:hypothetical protein
MSTYNREGKLIRMKNENQQLVAITGAGSGIDRERAFCLRKKGPNSLAPILFKIRAQKYKKFVFKLRSLLALIFNQTFPFERNYRSLCQPCSRECYKKHNSASIRDSIVDAWTLCQH